MSGQCSICLNDYRDPISIPCGHVYCFACLNQYANGPIHEGLKAACPTCRQEFHYVTPDPRMLPRKFHPFIMTHMRRVYMNPSDTHGQLQTDVTRLRKQVRDLRAQETALKARHEQQQKRAESYKKKFQNGTRRIEELEGQLEETKEALEVTRNKLRKVRKERDETMEEHVSMESVVEEMEDTVSRLRRERNETRDALTAAKADGVVKKRLIQTLEARLQESMFASDNYKRKFEELEAKVRRMERAQAAAAFTPPVTRAKARSHEALGASASTSVKRVRSTEGVTEASGSASRPRKVLRTSASTSKSARK